MEQVPENIHKATEEFLRTVRKAFGDNLKSVILYGPAARGEQAKVPFINFLVIVNDNTPSELAGCAQYVKDWRKKLIAMPLFLEPDYIHDSLDTYPLEFMDMASAYAVVYGEDVLGPLRYEPLPEEPSDQATAGDHETVPGNRHFTFDNVRNQCERELKGKLLHLRAEYLNLRGNRKGLMDLINRSLNTFRLVFAGALFLRNRNIPVDTESLLNAVVEAYELDNSLFVKLQRVADGSLKIGETETDELFDHYVEELDKLSHAVDIMAEREDHV